MRLLRKNIVISVVALIIGVSLFYNCSSSVPQKEIGEVDTELIYTDEVRLNVNKIYSWINAMPGVKPRFNVTGELEILENSNYELEYIKIVKVTILQDQKLVYIFTPTIKEEFQGDKKSIIFSTIRGLLLNAALDQKKSIDISINFDDGSTTFNYIINNVPIEKAL